MTCINRVEATSPEYMNTTVTFTPCTDPIGASHTISRVTMDQVYINVTGLSEDRVVPLSDPTFGIFDIRITGNNSGIEFGVS